MAPFRGSTQRDHPQDREGTNYITTGAGMALSARRGCRARLMYVRIVEGVEAASIPSSSCFSRVETRHFETTPVQTAFHVANFRLRIAKLGTLPPTGMLRSFAEPHCTKGAAGEKI